MKFHNIEPNNIENGEGIRTLLWVSGCFHKCNGCHNPVTHDPNDGVEFDTIAMTELLESLEPDYVAGLTLTGGDGLCYYPKEVLKVIKKVREKFGDTKTIWLYTGFTLERLIEAVKTDFVDSTIKEILLNIDVLCDGRFEEDKASKEYHWVGSTNQRVINMKESIDQGKIVFLEPDQEKICTINDNTYTNQLLLYFREVYKK